MKRSTPSRSAQASSEELECLAFPVESPLTVSFDPTTGILTLESTIHRNGKDRRLVRLRLDFSPDAAHGLVRLLRAVEHELGIVIADRPLPPVRQ